MKTFNIQPQFDALSRALIATPNTSRVTLLFAKALRMRQRRRVGSGGFTLVELLVSLLIVVLLLIGINKVFGTAAKTVEAGYSLSNALREHRSIETVIADDTRDMLPVDQQPAIIIVQSEIPAYIDQTDQENWNLFNSSMGWGKWGGPTCAYPVHRADTVSFFIHGKYRRQTGIPAGATGSGTPCMQSNLTGTDAWVQYGHLCVPSINPLDPNVEDNTYNAQGTKNLYAKEYCEPGATNGYIGSSPNNSNFAKNWVFGRVCMVLVPGTNDSVLSDSNGVAQTYFDDMGASASSSSPGGWSQGSIAPVAKFVGNPAAYFATSQDPNAPGKQPLLFYTTGTYDSSKTTMQTNFDLCDVGLGSAASMVKYMNAWAGIYPAYPAYQLPQLRAGVSGWWIGSSGAGGSWAGGTGLGMWTTGVRASSHRAGLNSFYRDANTDSNDLINQMSQQTPCLASGVTDVIVEFAGDYLNQQNPASLPANPQLYQTDGKIDVMDYNTDKRIRWYGMPRSVANNGYIDVNKDVVPVSWFFPYNNNSDKGPPYDTTPSYTPFEQWNWNNGNYIWLLPQATLENGAFPTPAGVTQPLTTGPSGTAPFPETSYQSSIKPGAEPLPAEETRNVPNGTALSYDNTDHQRCFVYAWGAGELQHQNNAASGWPVCARAPWLIRITIKITDPNNSQVPLQQYQYIMDLRPQ